MASEDRLNTIIAQVVTRLQGVTGIGQVHNYMRWASSEQAFNELALSSGVVNFWQVTRVTTQERWLTGREVWRGHTLRITGGYGLVDATVTERTFQNLVERVAAKFRSYDAWTLGETVESLAPYIGELASASVLQGAIGGIQVQEVGHVEKLNKLLHWAELRLGVQDKPETLT
jgi:hypothetical protein